MIIKNNFNENKNIYEETKKGLDDAVYNLDKRFKNGEIDREKFLKQNNEFAKRQQELAKKINKYNK